MMFGEIERRIVDARRIYDERFSALAFLEARPGALELALPQGGVRCLRFSLPTKAFLHLHSIELLDRDGRSLPMEPPQVIMSAAHRGYDASLAQERILEANGSHAVAFHTTNDRTPWVVVRFPGLVGASTLLVHNRAGSYSRRALGLVIEASSDGENWTVLHDNGATASELLDAVAAGDSSESAISGAADAAASVAAAVLASRYEDVGKIVSGANLTSAEVSEIRRAVNEVLLSSREMEWTSHGIRRSFRYWTSAEKASYVALTAKVCDDLAELTADVCLGFGSVLSIVRDGNLMKHDDDLDIIVAFDRTRTSTLSSALTLVSDFLKEKGYLVQGRFLSHWHVIKDGKKVDVFVGIYEEEGRIGWFPGGRRSLHQDDVFPPVAVEFLGSSCRIPRHAERYLESVYGPNWRSPLPGWKHDWDRAAYSDIA